MGRHSTAAYLGLAPSPGASPKAGDAEECQPDDRRVGAARAAPHVCWVHLALFLGQLSFGGGAIVGKLGMHGGNPVLFALVREAVTGLLLFLGGASLPAAADAPLVVATGFCVFANHICYAVGLKLGDPVTGSAWQPSQPIFTATLAILAGYERSSARKAFGILTAVAGAMFMILDGPATGSDRSETAFQGNALFLLNCLAASCYFLLSKKLLRRHSPALVTGWAYCVASVFMLGATCTVNGIPELLYLVCADEDERQRSACIAAAWQVPPGMVIPLLYYVLLSSLGAYFLVAWANQYAKASVVSAYTVVQTLTSSAVSTLMIAVGGVRWAEAYGLRAPGVQDLGVIPIVLGLAILFREPTLQTCEEPRVEVELRAPPTFLGSLGSSLGPERVGSAPPMKAAATAAAGAAGAMKAHIKALPLNSIATFGLAAVEKFGKVPHHHAAAVVAAKAV